MLEKEKEKHLEHRKDKFPSLMNSLRQKYLNLLCNIQPVNCVEDSNDISLYKQLINQNNAIEKLYFIFKYLKESPKLKILSLEDNSEGLPESKLQVDENMKYFLMEFNKICNDLSTTSNGEDLSGYLMIKEEDIEQMMKILLWSSDIESKYLITANIILLLRLTKSIMNFLSTENIYLSTLFKIIKYGKDASLALSISHIFTQIITNNESKANFILVTYPFFYVIKDLINYEESLENPNLETISDYYKMIGLTAFYLQRGNNFALLDVRNINYINN